MAEFNSCADLIKDNEHVKNIIKMRDESYNPLQDMLDTQNFLQDVLAEKLPKYNIKPGDIETKGQLVNWVDGNFDAIMDEFRELKNSIGGMSKGEKAASGVWKKWKASHEEIIAERLDQMPDDDRMEMLMEFIDILHFVWNIANGLGLKADDIYLLYFLKNYENFRRYSNDY